MRKNILLYLFLTAVTGANAQTAPTGNFSHEFSFTTENDAYLFKTDDAYYTNGFFFALKTAKEKNGKKIIRAYELGQKIYTPLIRKTAGPADIDRPYCGYLFIKFNDTHFTEHGDVLQYNAGIGQVGSASFGEKVQNSYHKLLNYARFTGWPYQVQDATGIDLGITYAHTLLEDSSWIKFMPVVQGNLGMNFTNANIGAYLCLGSFENNGNSALWNARVQQHNTVNRKKYELFVYWYPQLIVQGYNSTVEGGIFAKGNGTAVLREDERFMFQQNWGLCYAEGRWTTHLVLIYQTRETVTQTLPQRYGSIQLSYRFH